MASDNIYNCAYTYVIGNGFPFLRPPKNKTKLSRIQTKTAQKTAQTRTPNLILPQLQILPPTTIIHLKTYSLTKSLQTIIQILITLDIQYQY